MVALIVVFWNEEGTVQMEVGVGGLTYLQFEYLW